jgi:hypothetical protein
MKHLYYYVLLNYIYILLDKNKFLEKHVQITRNLEREKANIFSGMK